LSFFLSTMFQSPQMIHLLLHGSFSFNGSHKMVFSKGLFGAHTLVILTFPHGSPFNMKTWNSIVP
jgi:hypothetical protein